MNGYINVILGGAPRGIKFGNRCLLDIMSKHQVTEGIKMSFDLIVDLIYFGLINNCMIKRENVEFTVEQVAEWVDDMDMQEMLNIFEVFQKSFTSETIIGETKKVATTKATKKK